MKKKFISIFLTGVSLDCWAEVTLYGRVAAALENDTFPSANQMQPSTTSVQDYGSYFGIRGTDLVYGQIAAIWQIENRLDVTSGEAYQNTSGSSWAPRSPGGGIDGNSTSAVNTLASSDSYVGLQGSWGRVRIGNLSNTFRTNTGAVDIYTGNNANSMGNYDRMLRVIPQNLRYDSPTWSDVSFSVYYAFNEDGDLNTGGINGNGISGEGDLNSFNGAPILGFGIFYQPGNFALTWNNQLWSNVGSYQAIGGAQPGFIGDNPVTQSINAYASRIEANYNDPDGLFLGIGGQITQGLGWNSQPGIGNMNNVWIQNPAANGLNGQYYNLSSCQNGFCPLNQAVLSTAETGISLGWHINNWTPKIGYIYAANIMTGGNPWDIVVGNNQLGGTDYQQAVAELDWNITPRTIAFISYGQLWYGNILQNQIKSSTAPNSDAIATDGSQFVNNGTAAIGFSHTF